MNPTHRPRSLTLPVITPRRTVRARGLDPTAVANWLELVTAHLDQDDTLPFLTTVHIRLAAGHIHAYATDRYTGAIATLPEVTTDQDARFTIPGTFARHAIEWLRGEDLDPEDDGTPVAVDLTMSERLFGLTVHLSRRTYYETDDGRLAYYTEDDTHRLAVHLDPDAEVFDFPRLAAEVLATPEAAGLVHVNAKLLTRFLGYEPIVPFDPDAGRMLAGAGDMLAGFAVHNTGRVIVLTRPGHLGILATCRRDSTPAADSRDQRPTQSRDTWSAILAAIA